MLNKILIILLSLGTMLPCFANTDIAEVPLESRNVAKANLIFGLDDSGSMDFEVLMGTNDGALWWNDQLKSFTDAAGKPLFNQIGTAGIDGAIKWYKFAYLFPNGTESGARIYADSTFDHFAIPPIPAYTYLRSSDYNPLYYNPAITYKPWGQAYYNNQTVSFTDAVATAAKSHPLFSTTTSANNLNLTTNQFSKNDNWVFTMLGGMVIPGTQITGIQARRVGNTTWNSITTNFTIPNGETWQVAISYYPATYYLLDPSCTSGASCFTAPDGKKLRRYEIKTGNTFPSGRTYTQELQNFANWFTYYRKRKLLLSSAMGEVLPNVSSLRAGIVNFNNRVAVTMYDFDNSDPSKNVKALLGQIYSNPANSGTPTRDALKYIGEQFRFNNSIIEHSCQMNAAMILTDGFANVSTPGVPSYSKSTYVNLPPYATIFDNSLADLAAAYFTINLRPDLPTGNVLLGEDPLNPDTNTNLHMNTYALTIGSKGLIYGTNLPQYLDPFGNPPNWLAPTIDHNPSAVDDLWHATINGRGEILTATDAANMKSAFNHLITSIQMKIGTAASVEFSNPFINANEHTAFIASFNKGYGDLIAAPVNVNTGAIDKDHPLWSASDRLDQKDPNSRIIVSYNGANAFIFREPNLPANYVNKFTLAYAEQINLPHIDNYDPSDIATILNPLTTLTERQALINWIRGDMTVNLAGISDQSHRLGAIVAAEPVYVKAPSAHYTDSGYVAFRDANINRKPSVYQAANDGMLHAFDAATGDELWAYIPSFILGRLTSLPLSDYRQKYFVNATPTFGDAYVNGQWKTLLVGGLGAGGRSLYALDITKADQINSESQLLNYVMWEFPNNSTAAADAKNLGLTFGKPLIIKTKAAGWVVVVASGYNNIQSPGDGKGYLFVLNAATGAVIAKFNTGVGTVANPAGLTHLAAYAANQQYDATVTQIYAGDLYGNVWRFDLSGASISDWNYKLLATLVDAQGVIQPITSEPEIATIAGKRYVYVGTGKLLGLSDFSTSNQQSIYALNDDLSANPTITNLRSSLAQRVVSNNVITAVNTFNSAVHKGWYFDLQDPSERITTTPIIAYGVMIVNSNEPSATECNSKSYQYVFSLKDGLQLAPAYFQGSIAWSRKLIGNTLTTRPRVIVLPNNTFRLVSHNTDTTIFQQILNSNASGAIKKVAWKELLKD